MIGETAELAVRLKLDDQMSAGLNRATQSVKGMENSVSGASQRVSAGFGKASTAAKGLGSALGHARSEIGHLVSGPLGMIGLGAGLFTVAGAFEAGIGKAEEMAFAVEKLSAVTGMGAHEASQYLAVLEKYGIDSTAAVRTFGLLEKAIGKNTDTAKKAKTFADKFGISLVDAKGKALSAGVVFQKLADFENSHATAAQKAAAASTLLGRNWVALLPVLKLGAKGFEEAAIEADKLGLTLKTAQDVRNVHQFIAAQRSAKDAIAGLEVQLGLLVMPDLTNAFRTFTSLVITHRGEILGLFRQGVALAKQVATAVGTIGSAFLNAWNQIPPEFRQMLITGLVANKAVKMIFGIDVADLGRKAVTDVIGNLIKGVIGIQAGVVNVSGGVVNNPGGPGGGLPPGAAPPGGITVPAIGAGIAIDPGPLKKIASDFAQSARDQVAQGKNANITFKSIANESALARGDSARALSGILGAVARIPGMNSGVIAAIHGLIPHIDAISINATVVGLTGRTGRARPAARHPSAGNRPVVRTTPRVGIEHNRGIQAGGPAYAGGAYLVGEQGPEMFYPGTTGAVRPNAGARHITVQMNANVSTRSVDSGAAVQNRYGPTAVRAGAATLLV